MSGHHFPRPPAPAAAPPALATWACILEAPVPEHSESRQSDLNLRELVSQVMLCVGDTKVLTHVWWEGELAPPPWEAVGSNYQNCKPRTPLLGADLTHRLAVLRSDIYTVELFSLIMS